MAANAGGALAFTGGGGAARPQCPRIWHHAHRPNVAAATANRARPMHSFASRLMDQSRSRAINMPAIDTHESANFSSRSIVEWFVSISAA